jgi:hypothetical protein
MDPEIQELLGDNKNIKIWLEWARLKGPPRRKKGSLKPVKPESPEAKALRTTENKLFKEAKKRVKESGGLGPWSALRQPAGQAPDLKGPCMSKTCTTPDNPVEWEHILALCNMGKDIEANCGWMCKVCHKLKTGLDTKQRDARRHELVDEARNDVKSGKVFFGKFVLNRQPRQNGEIPVLPFEAYGVSAGMNVDVDKGVGKSRGKGKGKEVDKVVTLVLLPSAVAPQEQMASSY